MNTYLDDLRCDCLYHHGIKGQRWGVRRYQNKDGSLTAEGRKRYEEIFSAQRSASKSVQYDSELQTLKKEKGIHAVSPTLDIVKKGSVIHRVADSDEPIDDRVKYVSILDNDSYNYIDTALNDGLSSVTGKTVEKEYTLTKDLRVAPAEVVRQYLQENYMDVKVSEYAKYLTTMYGKQTAKHMMKLYGSVKLKDIYDSDKGDDVYNALRYNEYGLSNVLNTKVDDILLERSTVGQTLARKNFKDHLYLDGSNVYKWFREKGYDAIVDVEDQNAGLYDYPLIVLDPKSSMKFVKNNDPYDRMKASGRW